jgi:hypothetical protein
MRYFGCNLQLHQYLNSTFENFLLTSQFLGLSGMAIDGRHMLVLSIIFNGAGCLFFCSQGAECGFEKSVGDWTGYLLCDSHIFISLSTSFLAELGVQVWPWMRGFDGVIAAGDSIIREVV